ncbi:MAG: hypothetical protein QUV05_12250 [Phycisphaerae bacterium]|nr:hypothetical protein [Phycisphaerae bacterium]
MAHDDYPESVLEVLDDNLRFKPSVLKVMRSFQKSRPWSGSLEERKEKFIKLNRVLSAIYGVAEPRLAFGTINGNSSGTSYYRPSTHEIVVEGRLSVVTYLHEFSHARAMGEREACRWSINLFRQVFPRQFERLVHRGHMLIRPEDL